MTRRASGTLRQAALSWRVSHVDIAGGIIETRDGDYEITRVIGREVGLEKVRADIRLMAAAPALLEAAVQLHGTWEQSRTAEPAPGEALTEGMEALGRLIREALDLVEPN